MESSPLGRVTVYTIQGCPHCVHAKATLWRLGVPVCEVDLGKHPELRARVKELTGRSTVPQIFFNSVHVGGNDDLQKMAPTELERLVNLVKEEPVSVDMPPLPMESPSEDTATEADGGKWLHTSKQKGIYMMNPISHQLIYPDYFEILDFS